MKLIEKANLVAEIERIKKEECPTDSYEGRCKLLWCEQFLSFLDTFETKEVDLEKEMDEWRHNHFCGARDDKGAAGEWLTRKSQLDIAKHFFEFGLKVQKEGK